MSEIAISEDAALSSSKGDAAHPTPKAGLGVLAAVVVVLGIFVALMMGLGIGDVWVSFLFLLYWSGFEQGKFEKLPESVVGAVVGLAIAWGLKALPASLGTAGLVIIGAVILAAIYCLIVGWLRILVNYSTMLFLTVGTVPVVQAAMVFPAVLFPLGIGVVYFAGVAWLVQRVVRRPAAEPKA
jgi:hypothetical protein